MAKVFPNKFTFENPINLNIFVKRIKLIHSI